MEYLQLNWRNWSDICVFVKDYFVIGVYLDDKTKQYLNENHTSNTIGLFLKLNDKEILVKQDEYIIKENNTIKIMNQLQFDRKRKLEKLRKNNCKNEKRNYEKIINNYTYNV